MAKSVDLFVWDHENWNPLQVVFKLGLDTSWLQPSIFTADFNDYVSCRLQAVAAACSTSWKTITRSAWPAKLKDVSVPGKARSFMTKPPAPKYERIHHQIQFMLHTESGRWKVIWLHTKILDMSSDIIDIWYHEFMISQMAGVSSLSKSSSTC